MTRRERMRIVQLVNLVTEQSGGIRTALDHLGTGYAAAGHERHVIRPGATARQRPVAGGSEWVLPGTRVPRSGGYRVLLRRAQVRRVLDDLAPDVVEVSDRWTLSWVAGWARQRGVRSVAVVHEHLAQTMAAWPGVGRRPAARIARVLDRRLVEAFDAVVCGSGHSARPFGHRATVVPLGVDLTAFRPLTTPSTLGSLHVVVVGRLSPEKRTDLAIDAVSRLARRGWQVELDVIGDGPIRAALETRAAGLPVRFLGHLADRDALVARIAGADVAVAPCPIEAFGLAALEALACGTPVVGTGGGVADLMADAPPTAGRLVAADAPSIAAALADLGRRRREVTRRAARTVAERYPWSRSVDAMLQVLAANDGALRATA